MHLVLLSLGDWLLEHNTVMDVEIKSSPANDNLSCKHDDAPSRRKGNCLLSPLSEDKWRESVAAAPIIPLSFVNLLSVTCFRLYAGNLKVSRYEKALQDGNEIQMKRQEENTLHS